MKVNKKDILSPLIIPVSLISRLYASLIELFLGFHFDMSAFASLFGQHNWCSSLLFQTTYLLA